MKNKFQLKVFMVLSFFTLFLFSTTKVSAEEEVESEYESAVVEDDSESDPDAYQRDIATESDTLPVEDIPAAEDSYTEEAYEEAE